MKRSVREEHRFESMAIFQQSLDLPDSPLRPVLRLMDMISDLKAGIGNLFFDVHIIAKEPCTHPQVFTS